MECKRTILKLFLLVTCILILVTAVYAETVDYIYDEAGRLIRVLYYDTDGVTVTKVIDYYYDVVGNRISKAAGLSNIFIDPISHDFGYLDVGTSSPPFTFNISNNSTIVLELGLLTLSGTDAADFDLQADTCSGVILDPSNSCTFDVVFSANSVGVKSALIEVPSDDPNNPSVFVSLSGRGSLYELTANKDGDGTGTVASSPLGIDCGADCTEAFDPGTAVTLTATADANSTFNGWTGGGCAGTGACLLTISADTTVTATFNERRPDLTVTQVNGTVNATQLDGTATVKNEGTGSAGSSILGIYLSEDNIITTSDIFISGHPVSALDVNEEIVVDISSTLPASFSGGLYYVGAIADYQDQITELDDSNNTDAGNQVDVVTAVLDVTIDGAGNGTISSTPAGIDCEADCSEEYTWGTAVTLAVVPDATSTFTGWSGGGCSGTGDCVVIASTATTVTASFDSTLPDLVMSEISVPTNISPGESLSLPNTVLNQGGGDASGFHVWFYLSDDPVITTGDTSLGGRYVASLLAGASDSVNFNMTLSKTLTAGTYYIGAIADKNNVITESRESNNTTSEQVEVILSDLVMTDVSGPTTGGPGTTTSISNTVSNTGAGIAYGFGVGLYLSTDNIITTSDTRIGWPYIVSLAPGMGSSQNSSVTIPVNTVEGAYYIGAIADYSNGLLESDESNNALVSTEQIQINYADLTMTAVSGPASANPGDVITVSSKVRNDGIGDAAPSWIGFYLSDDPVITTSDTLISSRYVSNLGSGAENTGDKVFSLSTGLVNGQYYLGAIADYNGGIPETEEGNNALTGNQIIIGKLLTALKNGTGNGTVTSVPTGIDCGIDCDEAYSSGVIVTLTAVPDAMSLFAGWSGACSGTGDCVVTMNSDISVTATFSPLSSYISVDPVSFDFSSVEVGSSSPEQNFVVSNISANDLDIHTITISGADASEFTLLNDNCSNQTIPAGLDCTVQVQFTPSSSGNKSGVLSIPSSDPENPVLDVALNGLGYSSEGAYLIAGGYGHTGSIKQDGTVWSTGLNQYGQLGDGTNVQRKSPVQVGSDSNWMSVASGYYHTSALKDDGTLWSWGYNGYGQLGDGTNVAKNAPVQIGTDNNWAGVVAGMYYTVAVKSDGTLWAWGYNGYGQLGDGTNVAKNTPVQIGTESNWVGVAAGMNHTVAVKSDGTLWAWGYNAYGQLGDGTTTGRTSPVQVGSDSDWQTISAGYYHTIGTKTDGSLWTWGYNAYGQLGDGTNGTKNTPVQIGSDSDWTSVSKGAYHSLGMKADGSVWSWGWNGYGQLGDGTTVSRNVPGMVVYP
jgi:alpha-tubulin suppressor-like RCC1 family protein/subtilase family serine protease